LDTLEIFYEKLPDLIPQEKPALLHGDLWSGNVIADNQGNAVVIDPAVYYGLREAEIAFTRLFGGFEEEFYQSYQSNFPLSPGFEERTKIYNLYPLLVHLNLFGVSYLPSIRRTIQYYVGA
jgi:fructosamine-3-kinase